MMNGPVENYVVPPQSSYSTGGGADASRAIGRIVMWLGAWWVVSVFCDALFLTSMPDTISFWERMNDSQSALMNGTMFAIFYGPPAALLSVLLSRLWARHVRQPAEVSARSNRPTSPRTLVWTLLIGPLIWYYIWIYGIAAVFAFDIVSGDDSLLELLVGLPSAALWGVMFGTVAGIIGIPVFMLIGFGVSRGLGAVRRRRQCRQARL